MQEMSVFWLRVAVALYSAGLLHAIATVLSREPRFYPGARRVFSLAVVLHAVSLVERWRALGHLPVDNFFETASACAFLVAAVFLFADWRWEFHSLGVFLFPLVFFLALVGATEVPVETWADGRVRNVWLASHVLLVLAGYAALLMTAVASVFYLVQERQLKRKAASRLFDHLPPLFTLDRIITRAMGLGFVFLTLATIAGSTWAFIESGTRWVGDARVGIAWATWLLCLIMVFLRTSAGWRGRRAAVLALVIVGCSAATWAAHVGLRPALLR